MSERQIAAKDKTIPRIATNREIRTGSPLAVHPRSPHLPVTGKILAIAEILEIPEILEALEILGTPEMAEITLTRTHQNPHHHVCERLKRS
jgi:hypothetical protein